MQWMMFVLTALTAVGIVAVLAMAACQIVTGYVAVRERRDFEEWDRENTARYLRTKLEQDAVNFQLHGVSATDYLAAVQGVQVPVSGEVPREMIRQELTHVNQP